MNAFEFKSAEGLDRRYIVTGAAGHLGGTILRELSAHGCEAYGLLLPGQTETIADPHIRYFHGDVRNIESLRPLFQDAGNRELIVIHTAALISIARKMPPLLHDVNVNGTKNMIALCEEYHAKRLVYVSSIHALPELPNKQIASEISAFSPNDVAGGYAKAKSEAAQAVMDAAGRGLNAVTVFPSGILGPHDMGGNHLIQMVVSYMKGKLPACVQGGYDFVDVRDVADGCLRAAEYGRSGEGYILSGSYCSIERLLSMIGALCGRKKVTVFPTQLAQIAVPLIALHAKIHHTRPLYTSYSLKTLRGNSRFSNEKSKRELGYSPRALEETVADMVAWLKPNISSAS